MQLYVKTPFAVIPAMVNDVVLAAVMFGVSVAADPVIVHAGATVHAGVPKDSTPPVLPPVRVTCPAVLREPVVIVPLLNVGSTVVLLNCTPIVCALFVIFMSPFAGDAYLTRDSHVKVPAESKR